MIMMIDNNIQNEVFNSLDFDRFPYIYKFKNYGRV